MKICFVSNDVNPKAGLGRVVHSLAKEFKLRGNEVGIIAPSEMVGFEHLCLPLRFNLKTPLSLTQQLLQMRRFISTYDIVVAFDPRPVGILVHLAAIGLHKKIIIQTLGTYALFEKKNFIKNWLVEWVYKRSYKVFIINTFVQRCIEESRKGFKFGTNSAFVPVGVDTNLFYVKSNPTYTYAKRYILSVGGIKPRKGQLKSIQAFINIASEFNDLHYVIVGDTYEDAEYIGTIRAIVRDANMEDRIHFLQKITDEELIDLYSGAEFFILTPTTTRDFIEGFGMVYLEAALCGAVSIGTLNTGAEAAIEHERSGLLVSEDVQEISRAMKKLLLDPHIRVLYKQYARDRALLYDWTKIVDRYEKEITGVH